MTSQLPDLEELRVLEALLEERNVTRAARRLQLSQSGVSGILARLRRRFDDPLFVRAGGGVRPTALALALGPSLVSLLRAGRRFADLARPFVVADSSRTFTVASSDYATLVLLPRLAAVCERLAPGVDLRVIGYDKDDVGELLSRGVADVAIGVFPRPGDRFVLTRLFEERFVGAARADHPILAGPTLEAFAEARHALVTLRRDATGVIDAALAERGLARRVALTVPYVTTLLSCLRETDLITAIPSCLATLAGARGLATFPLPIELAPWTLSLLWLPETRNDPASRWLRDQLREAAGALAACTEDGSGSAA